MSDNLPLIPHKGSICTDVRPVLREVFRDRDYLPPLPSDKEIRQHTDPAHEHWIQNHFEECTELWRKEDELKQEHAKRVSRDALPNMYRLSSPRHKETPTWRVQHGLIARKDLIPALQQNAEQNRSLWVQNVLNRSSCDVSCLEASATRLHPPPPLQLLPACDQSLQSMSIGEVEMRASPPPAPIPAQPTLPDHVICVPPKLEFINFSVGKLHTQPVRVVNVSKLEIRLSLRPPQRRELDIMLRGTRGLTLTAGSAVELRVRFTPSDVRPVKDALLVRVSTGKTIVVPIRCYMQPPILEILVPNLNWWALSCRRGCGGESTVRTGGDVVELGARLLGDVHCARLLLHCSAEHAAFFVITEDAWLSYCLDTLTCDGAVVCAPFTLSPVWWRGGGGEVRGGAWCRAPHAGLHAAALRVISSTAVARPLHLLADALHFTPHHITLEAHEKDYDICSDDDPACEYYVNLGTAFPNRSLSTTIQLVNHSPVIYSYYWSVRPWGVCSCWEDEQAADGSAVSDDDIERLCIGAAGARKASRSALAGAVLTSVEPEQGRVAPRSSCALHVCTPDVGARLGVQRAVLMLILKDIPKESFPTNLDPMVVKTEMVVADPIPGHEPWTREVCEVVCCQLEVWWEVVPLRFALDPPLLCLPHSRRVKKVDVPLRATHLFGCDDITASWSLPERVVNPQKPFCLAAAHSHITRLSVPLPSLPNEYPEEDIFVLNASNNEWQAQSTLVRWCATRHPGLRPARMWLGIVPPRAHLKTSLQIHNDTYQQICWWGEAWRWWGENQPGARCGDHRQCERCHERACTCALLQPTRGALEHGQRKQLNYDVIAPDKDGCVATLLRMRRTAGDVAMVPSGAGTEARASLVFYRVLAPRLVLRALPCHGDKIPGECEDCTMDAGAEQQHGTTVLRPGRPLTVGRCTCYRLRFTNITPLPTTVNWNAPIEEDTLEVTFIPNDFDVGGYAQVEIRVVIKAKRVCGRRIFVCRASVAYAYKPLYLLIDAAVAGLEVVYELPLGGGTTCDETVIIRSTQKEQFPWEAPTKLLTVTDAFLEEDRKRAVRTENICQCRHKMVYIPEVKQPQPPRADHDPAPIEIVTEPPPLTRICACDVCAKPTLPDYQEPICLQFKRLPLKTVRTRRLVLRNESALMARWQTSVRYFPRKKNSTLNSDLWAADVKEPGVAIEVSPSSGVLGARARVHLTVSVYADCWGLYHDQILIMIATLEPLVVDAWVEAVGSPLSFCMRPNNDGDDEAPTMWMSSSDPNRIIRVKNTSRSDLAVQSYVLLGNEQPQDALPFRLYLRFFDVLPSTCPCVTAFDEAQDVTSEAESACESTSEEMDTGIEVFLSSDYGRQTKTCFKVNPETATISAGAHEHFHVRFEPSEHGEQAQNGTLLLRPLPSNPAGPCWYRCEPGPRAVQLRAVLRVGVLRASTCELQLQYCALHLPRGDVMRIRKTFLVRNVGNGHLNLQACTSGAWTVLTDHRPPPTPPCGSGCGCVARARERTDNVALHYQPMSSNEMTVEVCIHTWDVWPRVDTASQSPPQYEQWKTTVTPLHFYDSDNVLLTVSLILKLEYPTVNIEPAAIDFGFVADGDTRKSYFTVSHSSRTVTMELVVIWTGSDAFRVWPKTLWILPGASERVYVQYIATWRHGPAEGVARVECAGGAGGAGSWCYSTVTVRAAPARDHKCHQPIHDHTDDTHLLPPILLTGTHQSQHNAPPRSLK